jgi:hypothetical protein
MARPRFQFQLSTLLWIMLAVGCFYGGLLWDRKQGAELRAGLGTAWHIIRIQDEELADLRLGKELSDQLRAETRIRRIELEAAERRRKIESNRTWWGSVAILATWFLVIGIGWLVVIRRQSRPSATKP